MTKLLCCCLLLSISASCTSSSPPAEDTLRRMQEDAVEWNQADWGRWGNNPSKYMQWGTHSNRLIPIYVFGANLEKYKNENSLYRHRKAIEKIYGRPADGIHNPLAEYMDQTDVFRLQQEVMAAGKKYIFLLIFDGMDYDLTRAASIYKNQSVLYSTGRGQGLSFLDYRGAETDFGFFVTSLRNVGTKRDVNAQMVTNPGGSSTGGYNHQLGGATPWSRPVVDDYLMGTRKDVLHEFTDSAASATSMNSGIKTYYGAINVNERGEHVTPISRDLQREGWAIGVVTNVPISHATPACAYANNVDREDYQDMTRDLLGLRSISHRSQPLPGVDVLIGCGWGVHYDDDRSLQGENYVPGNRYISAAELTEIDSNHGGRYVVAQRTAGRAGNTVLAHAAKRAVAEHKRLFGFFGYEGTGNGKPGHLPYQTANGAYDPTRGDQESDSYTPADLKENPTLAEMTRSGIDVLAGASKAGNGCFWMMIEAGDVDWACHNNNIDDAIGSVFSGEEAFDVVTKWIETNNVWDESVVILTADHGHYFVMQDPEALTGKNYQPRPKNPEPQKEKK